LAIPTGFEPVTIGLEGQNKPTFFLKLSLVFATYPIDIQQYGAYSYCMQGAPFLPSLTALW
jgi:hypothetical protein